MIFVTVGTTPYPFKRVDKIIDHLLKTFPKENIIYQSPTTLKNSKAGLVIHSEFSYSRFVELIRSARVVICHGGPATLFLCLQYAKRKPFVIPRLRFYGEHVDNHQLYFVKYLRKQATIVTTIREQNIMSDSISYCTTPQVQKKRQNLSSTPTLIRNLDHFLESIQLKT